MMIRNRCIWATNAKTLYQEYHDKEWGIPTHDDQKLFEMLCLEGAQAGLSWITILRRRENYRKAFDYFNPNIVCSYDEAKINALLQDEGIIRNKLKIRSVVTNAKAMLAIQKEFGSFSTYIWQFVGGEPLINDWNNHEEVPDSTVESEKMSKDLKRRGFKFVGPTICYAFMQATGMVNDHTADCFLYPGKTKNCSI